MPDQNEQRMYDDQVAGNPTVNETQVRRAGRAVDDQRAVQALQDGDVAGAGSVQGGQTAEERGEARRGDDTSAQLTPSAQNAADSKSRTGKTQGQRVAEAQAAEDGDDASKTSRRTTR
jgi:hypothetical protein